MMSHRLLIVVVVIISIRSNAKFIFSLKFVKIVKSSTHFCCCG